jgi:hypothetical protein
MIGFGTFFDLGALFLADFFAVVFLPFGLAFALAFVAFLLDDLGFGSFGDIHSSSSICAMGDFFAEAAAARLIGKLMVTVGFVEVSIA